MRGDTTTGMGMVHAGLDVIGTEGRRATTRFLVDSGATYSVLPSPVVPGEGDDVALLGTATLETLGLVVNPLRRTLVPMRMRLATAVVV